NGARTASCSSTSGNPVDAPTSASPSNASTATLRHEATHGASWAAAWSNAPAKRHGHSRITCRRNRAIASRWMAMAEPTASRTSGARAAGWSCPRPATVSGVMDGGIVSPCGWTAPGRVVSRVTPGFQRDPHRRAAVVGPQRERPTPQTHCTSLAQATLAPMNYRHAFHAGNHADVLKHVTLLALCDALTAKPTPLFALDTHAGRGLYALDSASAQRTGEAEGGIGR